MTTAEVNHWQDDTCARAFWDQHKALPYQELLHDTIAWADPEAGERWLDLGCGGGQLTCALWQQSGGRVAEIVGMDCAAANGEVYDRLQKKLRPLPQDGQIGFMQGNFSDGLPALESSRFDGVISGLAISYAESRDPVTGEYTDEAYNQLLREVARVLRPGGRFVFSVNVPRPRFWLLLWKSFRVAFRLSKPGRVLLNAIKMQRYGRWLHREAARGRFHYFPLPEILARLGRAGFGNIRSRLSFADQAYLIAARKIADPARL